MTSRRATTGRWSLLRRRRRRRTRRTTEAAGNRSASGRIRIGRTVTRSPTSGSVTNSVTRFRARDGRGGLTAVRGRRGAVRKERQSPDVGGNFRCRVAASSMAGHCPERKRPLIFILMVNVMISIFELRYLRQKLDSLCKKCYYVIIIFVCKSIF
jgi:hypothetical protein